MNTQEEYENVKTVIHWEARKSTGAVGGYVKFWCEGEHSEPIFDLGDRMTEKTRSWRGIYMGGWNSVVLENKRHQGTKEISLTVAPEDFAEAVITIIEYAPEAARCLAWAKPLPDHVMDEVVEHYAECARTMIEPRFDSFAGEQWRMARGGVYEDLASNAENPPALRAEDALAEMRDAETDKATKGIFDKMISLLEDYRKDDW